MLKCLKAGSRTSQSFHSFCLERRHGLSTDSRTSIAVIGGGISGLSAAFFLQKALPHSRITLFEGSTRTGGWVSSKVVRDQDNRQLIFEEGPRSLRPAGLPGLSLLDLIRQLKLEDQMILVPKDAPSAKNRFIYHAGKVHKLPSSLFGFLRFAMTNPILKGSLPSLLMEPFRRRPKNLQDETINAFISRRFSPIMAQNMLSAVIHGIYSGSIDKLSIRSTFKALWEYESKAGSVIAGLLRGVQTISPRDLSLQTSLEAGNRAIAGKLKNISVYSFQGGLITLTNAITEYLKSCHNVTIRYNSCDAIERHSNTSLQLTYGDRSETFDKVVSTVRASNTSAMLKGYDLKELDQISYSTVMVINLFYRNPSILPIRGFGYLIPKSVPLSENPDRALGVVFDSVSVPGQDSTTGSKVTCIMGGHWWQNKEIPSKQTGYEATLKLLEMHLGITETPEFWNATVQKDCIPQYTVGHIDRMKSLHGKIEHQFPSLALGGSSYGGVSVNDCVLNSRKIALEIASQGKSTGLEDFATM